jgi:hypothetical protein
MGRALGKLTGRATGFIYKARAQLFDFAEKAELTKVQQELQMTMQQLQAIRSELQGGINILDPGPLSRQILGGGGGLRSSSIPSSSGNTNSPSVGGGDGNKSHLKLDSQQNNLPFAASGATVQAATNPTATASMKSSLGSLHAVQSSSVSPLHQNTPFEVLPISAAAAGLVPDRSQSIPTASEILADALQEEKVAHQALQFFQQQVVHTTSSTSSIESFSTNSTNSSDGTSSVKKKTRKPQSKKKDNSPS